MSFVTQLEGDGEELLRNEVTKYILGDEKVIFQMFCIINVYFFLNFSFFSRIKAEN